jgi:phosphate uptake regulator
MTFNEANRRRWQRDLEELRERVKRMEAEAKEESSGPVVNLQPIDHTDQELRRHKATIKTLEDRLAKPK